MTETVEITKDQFNEYQRLPIRNAYLESKVTVI